MTQPRELRAAPGGPELISSACPTALVAKWLVGLRLVAVSALLIGALLVQSVTEEILPIAPLVRVAGLTYLLSLVWIVLWLLRIPPRPARCPAARRRPRHHHHPDLPHRRACGRRSRSSS